MTQRSEHKTLGPLLANAFAPRPPKSAGTRMLLDRTFASHSTCAAGGRIATTLPALDAVTVRVVGMAPMINAGGVGAAGAAGAAAGCTRGAIRAGAWRRVGYVHPRVSPKPVVPPRSFAVDTKGLPRAGLGLRTLARGQAACQGEDLPNRRPGRLRPPSA